MSILKSLICIIIVALLIGLWWIAARGGFPGFNPGQKTESRNNATTTSATSTASTTSDVAVQTISPQPQLTIENYPKVDGSFSAHPLSAILACKILKLSCFWGNDEQGTKRLFSADPRVSITQSGTRQAYLNLINGQADLILVVRPPSETEQKLAQQKNIVFDAKPIAYDALVFLVNGDNIVNDLTLQQIQDIYTNKITDWTAVGGVAVKIKAYQAEEGSDSQEWLKSLALKGVQPVAASSRISGLIASVSSVSQNKNGLSYSLEYFVRAMAEKKNVKVLSINSIPANQDSIRQKTYPFVIELLAVVRGQQNSESQAYFLRGWLTSSSGQDLVEESGYLPLQP